MAFGGSRVKKPSLESAGATAWLLRIRLSNTTLSGSQEFDIFTSNAQPIMDTESRPYENLRDNFAGRLLFSIVPGFAEFEAGFTKEARQFPCPGGQMVGYELVGVNDEDSIL